MILDVRKQENDIKELPRKMDYHFIDFIKFMSIIGISSLHSIYFGLPENEVIEDFLKQCDNPLILIIFLQLMRFSVISFCMITGFLIATKITTENRVSLFYKRVRITLPSYIIAFILTGLYWYSRELLKERSPDLLSILHRQLFDSSFWYVPNTLLSLLLLFILFKKLPPLYLGGLLFTALTITTVKYVYITPTGHANPVFFMAFSFYIWLGGMFWKHHFVKYIRSIDIRMIFLIWVLSFTLLCSETYMLWQNGYPNIIHNLKVTNQIYAVVSFVFLIRISDRIKPFSIINPRKETYGIYLYSPLIGFVIGVILHQIIGYFNSNSALVSIAYIFIHFIITYTLTTIIVKLMLKHKLLFLRNN
jgi:probable poly-beta-1,6-N-acetyl-D-glucosamine export protein